MIIVTELGKNEIFVFGSNKKGLHGGGAALMAFQKFGAEIGIGSGPTGQCYAIPTLDEMMEKVPLKEIKKYIGSFIRYAKDCPEKVFFLTPIGTGIAGYTIKDLESILPSLPVNIIPTWM